MMDSLGYARGDGDGCGVYVAAVKSHATEQRNGEKREIENLR